MTIKNLKQKRLYPGLNDNSQPSFNNDGNN